MRVGEIWQFKNDHSDQVRITKIISKPEEIETFQEELNEYLGRYEEMLDIKINKDETLVSCNTIKEGLELLYPREVFVNLLEKKRNG